MRVLKPGIDLVVVNYKTPADLKSFVASLLRYEVKVPYSLYVMNNEPELSDLKAGKLIEDLVDDVTVVNSENIYYSGACNLGGSMGEREAIGLFNADTRFQEFTLDLCHEAVMGNPTWGALGPLQLGDQKEVTHAGIFGTLDSPHHRGWKSRRSDNFRDVKPAVTLSGSAVFTRRDVWRVLEECEIYRSRYPDVGGPLLPTTHYYEETWFCYHMQAHGYTPVYFGKAEMIHRWHKASPMGGWADKQFEPSRKMFREMCDLHGIDHD